MDILYEGRRFDDPSGRQLRRIVGAGSRYRATHNVKSHFFIRLSGIPRERLWLAFHHGYTTTDLKMRCYNAVNRLVPARRAARRDDLWPFVDQLAAEGVPRDRLTVQHNSVKLPGPSRPKSIRAARNAIAVTDGRRFWSRLDACRGRRATSTC